MSLKIIGRKKGMTRLFDDKGNVVAVTIISAPPNVIAQIKSEEKDGYSAIQIAAEKLSENRAKKMKKPNRGHFGKNNVSPHRVLLESKVEKADEYQIGQELNVSYFSEAKYVDVIGVSKGKGYQGVMKLHGYHGGPSAHGSKFHRHAGSTGMCSSPGRCLPGGKRASRMGADKKTVQSLKVVGVDAERNILIIKGSIPGSRESMVYIRKAIKKG